MFCVKFIPMQIRRKRAKVFVLGLLEQPLSETTLRICSAAEYRARMNSPVPYSWTSMVHSPLGGWLDLTGHRREWLILREVDDEPDGPVAPGIVAELLFTADLFSEFENLVCGNSIAYEHIMRLVSAIDGDSLITEAQAFARSARAKNAAIEILAEINNGIKL